MPKRNAAMIVYLLIFGMAFIAIVKSESPGG